jgi:hypothetical protein
LQAVLNVSNLNVTPPPSINTWDFRNPTLQGTVSLFEPFFQATVGGVAVTLPASPAHLILIQNLSTSAVLSVTVTPNGQAASTSTYGPNGVCILFDPAGSGGGFTALTLTGIAGTVPAMVFVGN